jgi:hypothetical protein
MAAHLLDTDVRRLAYQRDRLPSLPAEKPVETYADLLAQINSLNEQWVAAARRISPPVLLEFLGLVGPQVHALFKTLDPFAPAGASVAWAGEDVSPNWFDIAREYTEKWMHQQQIREATGRPGLTERRWLHPVLDTFLRGLPHTFRTVDLPGGSAVGLSVHGEAGGDWSLMKEENWALYAGRAEDAQARVHLDQDTAWRVFTKEIDPAAARSRARFEGDEALGRRVLELVAIMA